MDKICKITDIYNVVVQTLNLQKLRINRYTLSNGNSDKIPSDQMEGSLPLGRKVCPTQEEEYEKCKNPPIIRTLSQMDNSFV